MKIWMTPRAYWHLQWLCHRSENEVSCMGILEAESRQMRIQDVVLVKQEVSTLSVNLDMEWWADKQVDLFDRQGIEPWQSSLWIHTHPSGVNRPSSTDEATMRESFSTWAFAIMLILTKEGHFYARMDADHTFPWGETTRIDIACKVQVDWSNPEAITEEDLNQWESEYRDLVSESSPVICRSIKLKSLIKEKRISQEALPGFDQEDLLDEKEDEEYVDLCQEHGLNPYDPASFEALYGYWPGPGDFEFAGVSSFTGWD